MGAYVLTAAQFKPGIDNDGNTSRQQADDDAGGQARWRERHAAKLARKAARRDRQGPPTEESVAAMITTQRSSLHHSWDVMNNGITRPAA